MNKIRYTRPRPFVLGVHKPKQGFTQIFQGCGEFMRVPGTNGGGMTCGSILENLRGKKTRKFCNNCLSK